MKASRIISVLAVLFLLSIFASAAFASVNDDQVTSQKIKEADERAGRILIPEAESKLDTFRIMQ